VLTVTENTARLWATASGQLLAIFQGHTGSVLSAVFSPNGRRVLTGSDDKSAKLWAAENGKLLTTFQGHTDGVESAVFSPDGHSVLTASKDKTARLWEAESGRSLATFQGHGDSVTSALFSPNGHRVLTASAGTARLWETESGRLLATFQDGGGSVTSAVFSPDGRRVLTSRWDSSFFPLSEDSARLWEAESGELLATFQGHTDGVESAVFSPDGHSVLTASKDKTARLWPILPGGVPPPYWWADFLIWLGGEQLAPDGRIETLLEDKLQQLEAHLLPHMNEDTDYAHVLRWSLSAAEERPVEPYGTTTQAQAADLMIRPDMNAYETEHAYVLDPFHPLIRLALAGFEKDPLCADFLRRYSLDRLPNDLKLRQRAAEFLRQQGKEDLAREVQARGE
jgi:dipeptidyl aminopeptidase/acylaminoacyl peptidase